MEDYYEEYLELEGKIDLACECINSFRCTLLNSDIDVIKSNVDSLNIADKSQDSVGDNLLSIISSCSACLGEISSSISSLFSESENIYEELKELLKSLKSENEKYQLRYGEKPDPSDRDFFKSTRVTDGKDVDGNPIYVWKEQFDHRTYISELNKWKSDINDFNERCLKLKEEIEQNKSKLMDINASIVSSQSLSGIQNISDSEISDYFKFLKHEDIASLAVANGVSLLPYSKWGEDFLVLADISSGDPQDPDWCLDWANGYARTLLDEAKKNNTSFECRTSPIAYESKDWHETLKITTDELLQGRPVVVEVQGTQIGMHDPITIQYEKDGQTYSEVVDTGTRHYVMIYGIKKGADINNLKESDFLYLDPAMGEVKNLGVEYPGLQERHLFPANADIYKNESGYYNINVFSDTDYSNDSDFPTTTLKSERGMAGYDGEFSPHDFTSSKVFNTHEA